jgi:hypothetical protein
VAPQWRAPAQAPSHPRVAPLAQRVSEPDQASFCSSTNVTLASVAVRPREERQTCGAYWQVWPVLAAPIVIAANRKGLGDLRSILHSFKLVMALQSRVRA